MKKFLKLTAAMLFAVAVVYTTGCKKSSDNNDNNNSGGGGGTTAGNVTVTTYNPTDISSNEATCGVEANPDDINYLEEIGVCWGTSAYPTVNNNKLSTGNCDEPFVCIISNLQSETIYHVRGYALYNGRYYYGDDKSFTTTAGGGGGGGGTGNAPVGAIDGLFSVSANKQVYFSQGNLQYQASTNTWRFAENQWDWVGGIDCETGDRVGNVYENGVKCDNTLLSETYGGWIDNFGWGTSGYNHGAICHNPWSYTTVGYPHDDEYFYAYGNENSNLYDQSGKADWGYNVISNGGNQENLWRTLKSEEWEYLFNTRNTPSGIRYAKATVNGVYGTIVLPDNWNSSNYYLKNTNNEASYSSNIITSSNWETKLEINGAVFLPVTGQRFYSSSDMAVLFGLYVYNSNTQNDSYMGSYWSSNSVYSHYASSVRFGDDFILCNRTCSKSTGNAVRLVKDYQ